MYLALQNNPVLSFWHWYNIENQRDGGNIKISIDGVNWTLIFPVDGYPGIATWNNVGIPDEPCYSGMSGGWQLTSYILPVLTGQQFTIRWHLGSDNITTLPGWYIDDVMGYGFEPAVIVSATVNLTVFLQGLYDPATSEMNKAQDVNGDMFPGAIADKIQIQLAEPTYPYSVYYSVNDVDLNQDGTCTITVPFIGSYYLIIKHRNSIETWSSTPVSLLPGTISYNFSTASSQAYGSNLHEMIDKWVIYGGDVNQDRIVDSGDMISVDNDSRNFVTGYIATDTNGDGLIDSGDMIIVDNNAGTFVGAILPF
jgi:hypothetical protein